MSLSIGLFPFSEEWLSGRVLVQPRKCQDMTEKLLTGI